MSLINFIIVVRSFLYQSFLPMACLHKLSVFYGWETLPAKMFILMGICVTLTMSWLVASLNRLGVLAGGILSANVWLD